MECTYEDMLKRLQEERQRHNYNQETMGRILGMTQSNYCKAELGNRNFRYEEICRLSENGFDINYIVTGSRHQKSDAFLLERCEYRELMACLRAVYASWIFFVERKNEWSSAPQIHHAGYVMWYGSCRSDNIFLYLRQHLGYTQQKLAQELGIDIKKLRQLEQEHALPDSYIVFLLYKKYKIQPGIIIKSREAVKREINALLLQGKTSEAGGVGYYIPTSAENGTI